MSPAILRIHIASQIYVARLGKYEENVDHSNEERARATRRNFVAQCFAEADEIIDFETEKEKGIKQ